ncbi:MAG: hypothetical protein LBD86_00150 [Spirochaetaceae bacterium]|nr:hypothetical protein [Spirochaetaceae bacterium]
MLKLYGRYIFFLCFPLIFPEPVHAHPDIQYFEKSGIVQRISWEAGEDVLKYEMVIEKRNEAPDENGFTPILSVATGETNAELSLDPGEYRYRIIVYDLLGRMRPPPEWARLTVIPALQPEIVSVNPPELMLYDRSTGAVLKITGRNLLPDAEVRLTFSGGGVTLPLDKNSYRPNENGNSAELRLDGLPLEEGFYDIVVTNPGGISGSWRNFKVGSQPRKTRPFTLSFAEAYNPLIPSYGLLNEYMGQDVFPAGASLRFGLNSKNKRYGAVGVELQMFWHYLYNTGPILMTGHMFDAQINLLYQKLILRQKAALNVRAGGGLAYYLDLQIKTGNDLLSAESKTLLPLAAVSVSFTWFFHEPFFLELGSEFVHIFSAEKPQSAYIRPSLCLGFQI